MKGANLEILGFSNGQKKADGHSGNTRVPTAEQDSACFITSTTMDTGGQSQLFSPHQSWDNASTASQPGDKNRELNFRTCALQWDAKRSTVWGPQSLSN